MWKPWYFCAFLIIPMESQLEGGHGFTFFVVVANLFLWYTSLSDMELTALPKFFLLDHYLIPVQVQVVF